MAFRQRLTRANVGCMQDRSSRSSSVHASLHRPSSAPPGGPRQQALHGNGRVSPLLARLSLPTRNIRTVHSLPPAATTATTKRIGALLGRDIPYRSRPSTPRRQNSPMTSGATRGVTRSTSARTSEAEVLEPRTRVRSEENLAVGSQRLFSPVSDERAFWSPREESMEPTAGTSMPGRLLELVEDRDRAVHLCLQYRSKLRGTEKLLRDADHRASDLARQLGEAAAAEAATRKLLDRATEKAREEAGRAHSLQASRVRRENVTSQSSVFDGGRIARLQLARARKDLRELWLERDELAVLAGQAMQAESDGRERVKNFELVIQGLRERIASMKNVERDMAHEMAEIEAKAESAVKTKLELRSKVLGIKSDFEVLAQDLRQRDRRVQQLEAENATLAAEIASRQPNRVDVPPDPPQQGERRVAWDASTTTMAIGQDRSSQISYGPDCLVCSARQNETESRVKTHQASSNRERAAVANEPVENASTVVAAPVDGQRGASHVGAWMNHFDSRKVGRRAEDSSLTDEHAHVVQTRVEHPGAGPSRMLSRQLTPAASVLPGRVAPLSFPRKGGRVMLNQQQAESATPEKRGDVVEMSNAVSTSTEEKASEPLSRAAARVQSVTTRENPLEAGRASELELLRPPLPMPCLPSRPHGSAEYPGELSASPPLVLSQHGRPGGSVKPPRRQHSTQEINGDTRHNLFAENIDEYNSAESRNANRFDVREIVEDPRGSDFDSTAYVRMKPESNANITLPLSTRLETPDCYSNAFVPRLLDGIPVLKHSGRGKPKGKTLWVTPDLSEIYYTTRNSKQTSRMPLAELRAERGKGRDGQRFFSLVRIRGESHTEASADTPGTPSAESQGELHLSSSSSDDDARGRRFRIGDRSTSAGAERLLGSSAGTTSRRASLPFSSGARVRERMSFEMASGEERDALVEDINRLARERITGSSPQMFAAKRGR